MKIPYELKAHVEYFIGQFKISSGAIRFTDPCYSYDTWCVGSLPAANGTYQVQVGTFRDTFDEYRQLKQLKLYQIAATTIKAFSYGDIINLYNWWTDQKIKSDFDNLLLLQSESHIAISNYIGDQIELLFDNNSYKTLTAFKYENLLKVIELIVENRYKHAEISLGVSIDKSKYLNHIDYSEVDKRNTILGEIKHKALTSLYDIEKELYDNNHNLRNQYLHIVRADMPDLNEFSSFDRDDWIKCDQFSIGVDSGQAGMFDEAWYKSYNGDNEESSNDDTDFLFEGVDGPLIIITRDNKREHTMYEKLCMLSDTDGYNIKGVEIKKIGAGVFEHGCNSGTAYGDGAVDLFYRTNDKDEVIEAVYHYNLICDEDE